MSTEFTPYIPRDPGDLVTAEDWNELQRKIKADTARQIAEAVNNIKKVAEADNAHKLDNQTSDELTNEILQLAAQALPKRTGYLSLFKRLKTGTQKVIEHKLSACPLVDLYTLEAFQVVCSEDEQKNQESVFFYLYHSSERRIRFTQQGAPASPGPGVEIEPTGGTPFRIRFSDLLHLYKVQYSDSSTLDDLETEFWQAFFADPNDQFDDDQYCHSPWFDRCCGDRRSVGDLKSRGDWDELWFKMKPRKTVNHTVNLLNAQQTPPTPLNCEVVHFDFDRIGITFTAPPDSQEVVLNLMVLLKV